MVMLHLILIVLLDKLLYTGGLIMEILFYILVVVCAIIAAIPVTEDKVIEARKNELEEE